MLNGPIKRSYIPSYHKSVHSKDQTALRVKPCTVSKFKLTFVASVVLCLGAGFSSSNLLAEKTNPDKGRQSSSSKISYQSIDGSGNNIESPDLGVANTPYRRFAPSAYSDGFSEPAEGPNARFISNRIFEDNALNIFSPNGVTQWAWTWGQFLDHTVGLAALGTEPMDTAFDSNDPLENFTNTAGVLHATRSLAAEGTGDSVPREQINTLSSYLDAFAIYGASEDRLEWLREGPVDGDMSNNGAKLLLTEDGFLPTRTQRGDASSAPNMVLGGQLAFAPDADDQAIVAGDSRANENIGLTTVQTLFARDHNRIVDLLPNGWSEQRKFETARQLVIATMQYITYEEWLPAQGVELSNAKGYQPDVDPRITNEFATVGYRAHSMIHGEIEVETDAARYDDAAISRFLDYGVEVEQDGEHVELAVPLNVAFHRPQLVPEIGLEPLLAGLGGEPQYRNDEQFDNQLRSVLFQLPTQALADSSACLDGPELNECFTLVLDLGVLDIERSRDHGIARYNDLREAYGLSRVDDFVSITGESTEEFPMDDPMVDNTDPLNDPDIMDFVALRDVNGQPVEIGSEAAGTDVVEAERRSTLAARLKGIYSNADEVDAFVGMVSEPQFPGSEFGELQHAIWKQQFEALRDGDRFFYAWNKALSPYANPRSKSGLTWKRTLADVIVDNSELTADDIQPDMFFSAD